jgi:hypothetical protein
MAQAYPAGRQAQCSKTGMSGSRLALRRIG